MMDQQLQGPEDPNDFRSFTLLIHAPMFLPTVLAGLALRVPSFTVEDDRPSSGGWLAHIPPTHISKVREILDVTPGHYVSVHSWKRHGVKPS